MNAGVAIRPGSATTAVPPGARVRAIAVATIPAYGRS